MIHIVPINDTITHAPDCKCCDAYFDMDGMWIHHSADKREQFERQGKVGKPWQTMWEDQATGEWEPIEL